MSAKAMLDAASWSKPEVKDANAFRTSSKEELRDDSLQLQKALVTELSRLQQDLSSNAFAERLLQALGGQQVEHERRIEALLARQEIVLSQRLENSVSVVPKAKKAHFATEEEDDRRVSINSWKVPKNSPPLLPNQTPEEVEGEVVTEISPKEYGAFTDAGFVDEVPEDEREFKKAHEFRWMANSASELPEGTGARNEDSALANLQRMAKPRPSILSLDEERVSGKGGKPRQSELMRALKDPKNMGKRDSFSNMLSEYSRHPCGWIRVFAVVMSADRRFELLICLMILTNSILIGVEADVEMKSPLDNLPVIFRIGNVCFTVFFTLELILRLIAEGSRFFDRNNGKLGWNCFDTLLVVTALFEEMLQLFVPSSPDTSSVRILRTMRIVRGFRIVRVFAFFRDLRIMVAGITHSMQSLVWALILLLSMMYLFAVCFLQFATDEHASQLRKDNPTLDEEAYSEMLKYYGDLSRTIYTLYQSIVGGIDWGDAAEPLLKLNTFLGILFCGYISFAVLCVLNIITGVFVENANRTTAQDQEMVMMEQVEQRQAWFEEVRELFEAADSDGSGSLDRHEFTQKMGDLRMQAWFRKIGVQVESYSANGLFKLLDFDGDGKLDLDEFAMALQQVHGAARSIDIARVNREVKLIRKELRDLGANCGTIFAEISGSLRTAKRDDSKISPIKNKEDLWASPRKGETGSQPALKPRASTELATQASASLTELEESC